MCLKTKHYISNIKDFIQESYGGLVISVFESEDELYKYSSKFFTILLQWNLNNATTAVAFVISSYNYHCCRDNHNKLDAHLCPVEDKRSSYATFRQTIYCTISCWFNFRASCLHRVRILCIKNRLVVWNNDSYGSDNLQKLLWNVFTVTMRHTVGDTMSN